jgi:hypothetical protein
MKQVRRFSSALLIAFVLAAPGAAQACTACMGDPNTNIAKGANAAIFLMLGVLAGVFGLLIAFGIYLYRRSLAPTPPHAELGDSLEPQAHGGII